MMLQTDQGRMVILQHAVLNLEGLEIARYSPCSLVMQQSIFLVDVEGTICMIIDFNGKHLRRLINDRLKTFPQIFP